MDLRPIVSVRSGRSDVMLLGKPRFMGLGRPCGAVLARYGASPASEAPLGFLWALSGLADASRSRDGHSWSDLGCLKGYGYSLESVVKLDSHNSHY
jgi:hypothetical protein